MCPFVRKTGLFVGFTAAGGRFFGRGELNRLGRICGRHSDWVVG